MTKYKVIIWYHGKHALPQDRRFEAVIIADTEASAKIEANRQFRQQIGTRAKQDRIDCEKIIQ